MKKVHFIAFASFLCLLVLVAAIVPIESEAIVQKNWYVDDGCGTGLSDDGHFFTEGDGSGFQVRSGGANDCYLTLIAWWPGTNYAEWYLPVNDPAYQGIYTSNAYLGVPVAPKTTRARYQAWANGHCCGVTTKYFLNQAVNNGGFCYSLGNNNYGNGGLVRLVDNTKKAEKDSTVFIVIDEFCFVMP